MRLTELALASHHEADQAALPSAVNAGRDFALIVAEVFGALRKNPAFIELLARHRLLLRMSVGSSRKGRSGTDEGIRVLELIVLRGCVTRILSHADVVIWLARHESIQFSRLNGALDELVGKGLQHVPELPYRL